jgi:hypothetical protein
MDGGQHDVGDDHAEPQPARQVGALANADSTTDSNLLNQRPPAAVVQHHRRQAHHSLPGWWPELIKKRSPTSRTGKRSASDRTNVRPLTRRSLPRVWRLRARRRRAGRLHGLAGAVTRCQASGLAGAEPLGAYSMAWFPGALGGNRPLSRCRGSRACGFLPASALALMPALADGGCQTAARSAGSGGGVSFLAPARTVSAPARTASVSAPPGAGPTLLSAMVLLAARAGACRPRSAAQCTCRISWPGRVVQSRRPATRCIATRGKRWARARSTRSASAPSVAPRSCRSSCPRGQGVRVWGSVGDRHQV